ncbi:hypothetical protein L3N51_01769 [Metallosphaera sp. J1]|uniref:adenosylcobinamide amidohydrolase n=1 Tax=Metallosphaera TaxID=41980 RepID=UPI001EE06B30|nr:adenosylcobinamide amidohydrolase [Metallosphaera javensis (ex Hofmann et al. 2022)]MCG3109477.1 hypothetical protein [Metallosphaera javensis (ex Hofmann et al. 2022)]BCS93485.1 MAG: coenzyme F390 synthetase [Metallosphaera javensis (ex Sakai et al. 2022)]
MMKVMHLPLKREYIVLTSALYPEGVGRARGICAIFVDKAYCNKDPWSDVRSLCAEGEIAFITAATAYSHEERSWGELYVSAGVGESGEDAGCTINVGAFVNEGLNLNGLVDLVRTVTEAKSGALRDLGLNLTGTVSDAVAVGSTPGDGYFAGPGTALGKEVARDVRRKIVELLRSTSSD